MKKIPGLTACICISLCLHAQQSFRFDVEKLEPVKKLLPAETKTTIFQKLLIKNTDLKPGTISVNVDSVVVASYKPSGPLVNYGYHSFFDGMYKAYAEHRPFVLSPDIIWLLISQGFAQHVNNNAEAMRKHFVNYAGRVTLMVQNNKIILSDPDSPWEKVFPEFSHKIAEHTGNDLISTLTADFTTTTPVSKIASQITIMDALKKYFEYVILRVGCGIPSITIEGTPEDWQKVYSKTEALEKYELGWWTKEIKPLLKEFINAANKKVNADFWRNMFKYHETNTTYKSKSIDGWIIKFFPYNKQGQRNNLDSLWGSANLPDEICKVDLLYLDDDGKGNTIQTPLELCAGFTGLKQDDKTFALKPEIGWYITRKDSADEIAVKQMEEINKTGTIHIRVNEIPVEITVMPAINRLIVEFTGDIHIPLQMTKQKINTLVLKGKISDEEAKKITALFPDTKVTINGKDYRNPDNKMLDLSNGW